MRRHARTIGLIVLPVIMMLATTASADQGSREVTDAWALYDRAFLVEAAGYDAEAMALFQQVWTQFPQSTAAPFAAEMVRLLQARQTGVVGQRSALLGQVPTLRSPLVPPVPELEPDTLRTETPSRLARAELVTGQTIHGIALGIEAAVVGNVTDGRIDVLLAMLGGGAGLGLTLLATSDGVTPGQALVINSATAWGAFNGAVAAVIASDVSSQGVAGILMGSQLAGLGLGVFTAATLHPSSGAVSLANSGGLWFGVESVLIGFALNPNMSGTAAEVTVLTSVDVGILAGALLARALPMSRSRVLLIDSGGAVGALVGLGVAAIASLTPSQYTTAFTLFGAAGTAGGLVSAGFLTRSWDLPETPATRLSLIPTPNNGRALALAVDF